MSVNKQRAVTGSHMDSLKKQTWETWLCHIHPSAQLWKCVLSQTTLLGEPKIPEWGAIWKAEAFLYRQAHSPSQKMSEWSWQLEWSTAVIFCFLTGFRLIQPRPSVRGLKQQTGSRMHLYRWNTVISAELKKGFWAWNAAHFFHLYQLV